MNAAVAKPNSYESGDGIGSAFGECRLRGLGEDAIRIYDCCMELRAWALEILENPDLHAKLAVVRDITDTEPGSALRVVAPARPEGLHFCRRKASPLMPHALALVDPHKRAVAHHIMANHELQALEVMAFVVLAFPEAPAEFRAGLARIMAEEQRHTRWHLERLTDLGHTFGEWPVNGYFWRKGQEFQSLLDYLAGLPLTFEGCNLDHTLDFAALFRAAGDDRGAGLMEAIHRDEIRHVAFGMHWLRELKPAGQTDWDAYVAHLKYPLRPSKSRGKMFRREARLQAGMTEEFVARLEAADDDEQAQTEH